MIKSKSVDAYIAKAPKEHQAKLREMRRIIRSAAPQALEKLSYGMPYYHYKGRLAYFAFAKKHIGLYIPPPIIQEHVKELNGYVTAKATVQLPLERKLPITLIKKLIKARMRYNKEHER